MSARCDGGPAFPAPELGEHDFGQPGAYPGMSLRDYFAAAALTGLLHAETAGDYSNEHVASISYLLADAMVSARASTKGAA